MTTTLKPKYPKHLLHIKDKIYEIGNDFNLVCDKAVAYRTLDFRLPFSNLYGIDTTGLAKYDVCKLYFKYYDTPEGRDRATISQMKLIFNGYIEDPQIDKSPTSREWNVKCKGVGGLLYKETSQTKFFETNLRTMLQKATTELQIPNLQFYYDTTQIKDNFILQIESDVFFGKVIDSIRDKYAINCFGVADGGVAFKFPAYFTTNPPATYVFEMDNTMRNLNHGSKTNSFDCVVVVGTNCIGIAFDPISYALKNGLEVGSKITPDPNLLSVYPIFRRDLFSDQDCQEIAKNELYEAAKNYSLSFDTDFNETMEVGELLKIRGDVSISENQLWIISKMSHTISGENMTTSITAYSNAAQDFPQDILISKTGLYDVDTIQVATPKNILSGSLK